MSAANYVLFPLGKKRFALPSDIVAELARKDHLYVFPHTTPLLTGVLVRRGRVVPVCDIAQVLLGADAPPRKFFLIASRVFGNAREPTAIPVTGECELVSAEPCPPTDSLPAYITAVLSLSPTEMVEVLDLEQLALWQAEGSRA